MKRLATELAVLVLFLGALILAHIKSYSVAHENPEEKPSVEVILPETSMRKVGAVIIHHSATSVGNVEIFRRYHIEERGWSDVGYHYVITNGASGLDGEIQLGRPESTQGAHDKHRNNGTIGVCLVGTEIFTEKQVESLVKLLVGVCRRYNIEPSVTTILPHHEECPGHGLDLEYVINRVKSRL